MKYESYSVHYYISLREYWPKCPPFATNSGHFFELNLNFHVLFERLKFRLKLKFKKHSSFFLEVLALVLIRAAHPAATWCAGSAKSRKPVVVIQILPVRTRG